MRTNIEIDDRLMKKAIRASGAKTKKAAVEEGSEASLCVSTNRKGHLTNCGARQSGKGT